MVRGPRALRTELVVIGLIVIFIGLYLLGRNERVVEQSEYSTIPSQ
jgi:hypothetical protein